MLVATAAFLFSLAVRRTTVRPVRAAPGEMLVFARAAPTLLLMVLLFGALDATFLSAVPGHLARLGAPAAQAALVVTAVHIGMVAAQPILGVLLDRYSYRGCMAGCLLTASASFAALAFLPVDSPALLFVAAAGGAAFFGIYVAALAALGHRFSGGMLLSGASAFGLAYAAGGMIGPLCIGLVSAVAPAATFPALAVVAAAGFLLLAPASPSYSRRLA